MTGTTASTLGSLHEAESEQALGRSASSSVCEYAGALGRDASLFCEDVGPPLLPPHAESSSVYTFTHESSNSAADFRREGTHHSPMIVDGFTRCSFGGVSDAGLVIPNVLPSGMSSVQSSSAAAERANFALVGPVNGCFRGANESMSENPGYSKTLPSGEDHGERRECTLDALTLNEVSGAAAPVTPHTHLLGDPCLAHVLPFDMSSVQSSSAAERAKFAMVGPANGCSRGANESMSEILVASNIPPFGEDYGDRRECTLEALTLNEVSGAAVPVTLHTHLPGDPCPAHSPVVDGTRDRAVSKNADVVLCRKQGWPRGRRVDSRTTRSATRDRAMSKNADVVLCRKQDDVWILAQHAPR